MRETTFIPILVKYISSYRNVLGFEANAFYSDSKETRNTFGDAVYFVDTEWLKRADREIWGS